MEKEVSSIFGAPIKVDPAINDEVVYQFVTEHGIMRISPSEILKVLKEMSNQKYTEVLPPEEDLQGWEIINATDEDGKSHPLFLMRALPACTNFNYTKYIKDDSVMADLILREVYKVTPSKIKWIKFKLWISGFIQKLYRRGKK